MNNNTINNLSFVLQVIGLLVLLQDYNNSDLMNELQKQDTFYFDKILKNQEKIISLLEERK